MRAAVAVVTKRMIITLLPKSLKAIRSSVLLFTALVPLNSFAAILPEDRLDVLYHSYVGGGANISGPSILVRKSIGNSFSVSGNLYLDLVTSATIDVVSTGASEYNEERTEYSVGVDYLRDKTIMSLSYSNSSENDYEAETFAFGISQDFFGDLTNISVGITFGRDEVYQNVGSDDDPELDFQGNATHRRFNLGISQIITKNLLIGTTFESVIDEGELENPYRVNRFLATVNSTQDQPEVYPNTRNSDAFALRGIYFLPYRASVRGEYRIFSDSWGIEADTFELRYVHPLSEYGLTLEGKFRAYEQTQANFYSDLFFTPNIEDRPGEFIEFRARDKEMSEFTTTTIGFGITYDLGGDYFSFIERSSLNFYLDHIQFDYANFRDRTPNANTVLGNEPLYNFNANVIRFFYSAWF